MRNVGADLVADKISMMATSPLQRCSDFSHEMGAQHGIKVTTLENMREMDFGDWENRSFDDLEVEYGALLHQFWESPVGFCPPNGESFADFSKRVLDAWNQWLENASGEHRVLVAHGGVIRVILAHLLGIPLANLWRIHLPYASWNRVSLFKGEQPRVLFMNREPS